jgi:hypothetical protein
MHNVHTIHGASMTAWLSHADPSLIRADEIKHWDFDTEEEAAAFGLALNYANQVADCQICMLDPDEYDVLRCV